MGTAIRVSDNLARHAKARSLTENRSITGQIEYWAKIGKCIEENPDLTFSLIKEIITGVEELDSGQGVEYRFG